MKTHAGTHKSYILEVSNFCKNDDAIHMSHNRKYYSAGTDKQIQSGWND